MKFRSLLAAVSFAFLFSSPPALAGQDRVLYPPSGGPGQGGVIRSLVVVGATSTYWAAVEGGGIYKSTDGGASWSASHQGLGHKLVRGLAVAPGGTTVMYAVTNGGGGFYKSTDSGATWSVSNNGLGCTAVSNMFIISTGTNVGRVYLGTACGGNNGVYMSSDQGGAWTLMSNGTILLKTTVFTISGPADGAVLRASTSAGVYYSFDFGATWTLRNGTGANAISGPNGQSVISTTVLGSNTIAVVDGNGLFYSGDSGVNWFPVSGLPAGTDILAGFSTVGVAPSPVTAYVFVDGAGMYRGTSTDNGVNWTADTTFASGGLPAKRTRFVFREGSGPTYWAGTISGVYKSADSGASWTKMSNGLPQGFVNNVNSAGSGSQSVLAAADTVYKSADGGLTWNISDTGLGGVTFISSLNSRGVGSVQFDASNPSVAYASTVNAGMFKSTDGGTNWSAINNGLPANPIGKGGNFRIAPSNPSVLYVAMGGVLFKTVDGGANWSNVWTNPPVSLEFARAPAIDPTNPSIVYVATAGGLYKTTDGGASWFFKHPGGFGTPFGVSRPQVMSGAPQNVLLAAYNSDSRDVALSTSGVYLSTNGGDTWKQLISNEKITQAIFVNTPGSSRVSAYVNSLGYFDAPSAGLHSTGGVYKCVDVLGDFSFEQNCEQVDLGPDPGLVRSFLARSNRLLAVATTSGAAKHEFMFLGPDFNNDSRADILWRHASSGGNAVWQMAGAQFLGNPDGFSAIAALRTVGNPWTIAGLGDFDGNGTTDILWRNTSTGENYIYFMDGGSILPSEGYIRTVADQTWQVAGIGDFDGDGRSDILWRNASTGNNYIYFMNGLQIVTEGFTRTVADPDWTVAAVGDFDGDGKADIFWRNTSSGQNYIHPMDGTSVKAGEGFIRTVPASWQVKGLGDFNQDNKMDIVWRNSTTGENYVYPMDGFTILPSETYLPTVADLNWNIVGVGDYNGPDRVNEGYIKGRGISGILWRNSATGAAYLWSMFNPLQVSNSACGSMGCPQGFFLPQVTDVNWQIVNK